MPVSPTPPANELALLPAPAGNPSGRKSIASAQQHRAWVDTLPDFLVPTTLEIDGATITKHLPFDKAKILPYAYRHTYAQRHADAGVDPGVLRQLMDHRQLTTTQAYYRVRDERRRDAVDRVTAMQFDRHGNRIWRKVQDVLDSEHIRRGVGEISELERKLTHLEQANIELTAALDERTAELEAARAANRELTRSLNHMRASSRWNG